MYSVIAIANFFIQKGINTQNYLTPMKLQKLVYFAHGWHLAIKDHALIDSSVEAWEFGPVIPILYHELKSFGNKPITSLLQYKGETPQLNPVTDVDAINFLNFIWDTYAPLNAFELSDITHEPNSPWDTVAKRYHYRLPKNKDIEDKVIRDYFVAQKNNIQPLNA